MEDKRVYWTRIIKTGSRSIRPDQFDAILEYLMTHESNLWHASWEILGRRGNCYCAPCVMSRGEPPL